MEMNKFMNAKDLMEEVLEIEKLINKFNGKNTYESAEEYDNYAKAREALHVVLSLKKEEFSKL